EAVFRKALAIRQELVDQFAGTPDHQHRLAEAYRRLGLFLQEAGRGIAAEQAYRRALTIERDLVARYATESEYSLTLGWTLSNLGQLLYHRSKWTDPDPRLVLLVVPAAHDLGTALVPVVRVRTDL